MLQELLGHCLHMNADGYVVVPFIKQHIDNFRLQDFAQYAENPFGLTSPVNRFRIAALALL